MKAPRWKTLIENAIAAHKKQTVIQVATLDSATIKDQLIPRVRSQIFRSFLSAPNTPSLPVLLSTTDIRTPKVTQLTSTSSKSEVVWWIEGTRQQFRFIADIYVVPEPQNHLYRHFEDALQKANRDSALASLKDEDWEKQRVEMFHLMSPQMKACWCRPTPGTKLKGGQEEAKGWPEKIFEPNEKTMDADEYENAKKLWETALKNFVLMIVDPIEVDFVDLGANPNTRSVFRKCRLEENGIVKWIEEELVP